MNWKLLALGKGLKEKKLEGCGELFISSTSQLVRYTDKCMEISKHDWTLSGTATSPLIFSLKSFS